MLLWLICDTAALDEGLVLVNALKCHYSRRIYSRLVLRPSHCRQKRWRMSRILRYIREINRHPKFLKAKLELA